MKRWLTILTVILGLCLPGIAAAAGPNPLAGPVPDFDGDGRGDIAVYHPTDGTWYILQGGTNFKTAFSVKWGDINSFGTQIPLIADFDNDGRIDLALYNKIDFTWYILQGGSGFKTAFSVKWGGPNFGVAGFTDIPVPGDYDGDGKLDIAVYHPSEAAWYILQGGTGFKTAFSVTWGVPGTLIDGEWSRVWPVPADYDADGLLDIAVFSQQDLTWYILQGGSGFKTAFSVKWGAANAPPSVAFWWIFSDIPVPGDYDGDGKIDLAVYHYPDFTWYILQGATNFKTAFSVQWGAPNFGGWGFPVGSPDIPVPGFYDNDNRLDIAVFHPTDNTWYILQGGTNFKSAFSVPWGAAVDQPISMRNPAATRFNILFWVFPF
jgi:hypothetical protein